MPELPEVETTLRGIKPYILNQEVKKVIVRQHQLRWLIPSDLDQLLEKQIITAVKRRAKYLLFQTKNGSLLLHLGMSGRVRILKNPGLASKHDHVDIYFSNDYCLRFNDARRFGALLWTSDSIEAHPLLSHIGPEPLTNDFSGRYLLEQARNKKVTVKSFIMNSRIVAGVGNIYAAEALFQSGIAPQRRVCDITLTQYQQLAIAIKLILKQAIKKGGTTLKDFMKTDGKPGYFSLELQVYGREGQACKQCKFPLKSIRITNRSTVYCPLCQK